MQEYYLIRTELLQLSESKDWSVEIGTYSNEAGNVRLTKWLGSGPFNEDMLESMTILWQTLMCQKLNVQLGLDLGLLA